ncbi:MAG: penicillin-binding protein 2 [Patescibacteria group bacterium]
MNWRYRLTFLILLLTFIAITGRLFYWQVVKAQELYVLAQSQYGRLIKVMPLRGEIKTSDGFPIAANKISYLVFANPREVKDKKTAEKIAAILKVDIASISAKLALDRLWVSLKSTIDTQTKESIESLNLPGVGFEEKSTRFYPEASMSSQMLGFVGKNELGEDKGYFGLEGYYDRLLRGRESYIVGVQDALGRPILSKATDGVRKIDGSNLILSVDRPIQFLVEKKLKEGIETYGATSGVVGVMNPKTGEIIAMASFPTFVPSEYQNYPEDLYKNPFVSSIYEPGSTIKPIVMAGALDAHIIKPETKCPICSGPVVIGDYELHTWNDKYYKDINMIDVIIHSDNTGMVYVAQKLGVDKMISYLNKFGIGSLTYIDSQGEIPASLKPKNAWYPVDLATTGFGQGISVTPIQLLTAFSAIANNGKVMQPHFVSQVESLDGEVAKIPPKVLGTPISEQTAKVMTEILVSAVNKGEAQWVRLKGYRIAGKTGTASIPVKGHYDPSKTITSFIGFAPAENPKFVMLVILDKPTVAIYGAETAAPIFFDIARDILSYYGIPPSE